MSPGKSGDLWRLDGDTLRFAGPLPGGASFAVSLRNAGSLGREDPEDRFHSFFGRLGLTSSVFHHCKQVHGAAVLSVDGAIVPFLGEGDGVYALSGGSRLGVFTADCMAVALVSETGPRALVHSGWRGTEQDIAGEAVSLLSGHGAPPESLTAVFGPSAHPCCYEVGEEFRTIFPDDVLEERDGRLFFDNQALVVSRLRKKGVPAGNIFPNPYCTICRNDIFYSYRKERTAAGRMLNLLY